MEMIKLKNIYIIALMFYAITKKKIKMKYY